ncbi:MAG TPA: TPM domain-containing protein, partial [Candidatus Caenarcaniphilales bacterium]
MTIVNITNALWSGILGFTVISFPTAGLAVTVSEVPNPRQENGGWVSDTADMLSSKSEADLNRLISGLEAKTGDEITVVTVPETKPSATPKEFASALFNSWGVGKKGQDNGVLFLISKGERRVEIETGYGLESILPDALVGNIISQKITPQFKQGNFEGGTLAGTKALIEVLSSKGVEHSPSPAMTESSDSAPQPWTRYGWLELGGVALAG